MGRLRIDIPESEKVYSTDLTIRIGDVNYGGHMGNDVALSLCHEARVRFFSSMDMSEKDLFGKGIIMSDAAVVYKAEAFHGDQLKIDIYMNDFSDYGLDLVYRTTKLSTGKEVFRAKTGIVFFDYQKKKISRSPAQFIERFG